MGEEITTIDISNAEVLPASSFTNVKNSIDIKIDNLGNLTDANDNAVTMLNFGDRGDHCVTVINAELPSNFSEGYLAYFLVDLKNKTYIQKCLMEGNIAKALITKEISLDSQSTECLFALIEANATTGNLREQQEIFVSDVFMGTVRSNFLDSNWMDADISVSEDLTVLDKFETPNPDKYTSMIWVNGETKLNAANMNNIIKGIDELKEQAVAANPTDDATATLSKLKVGDTTYDFNRTLIKNGTYVSEEGFATLNSFSFTAEEMEKINNGEIDMLIGEFNTRNETYYYNAKKYYSGDDDMPLFICSSYTLMNGESIHYNEVQIYPSLSQGGMISADSPFIPELPSDASTKKYTLKAVNGTLTWVDPATDTETFNNIVVNNNVTAQGNISAVGKISTVGGLEVYGNSVFTKDLSTSATLKGAHVVSGATELLPVTPNPADEATETLSKLKVGNTTYGIGSDEIVEANGTFMLVEDGTGIILNTISFDNNIAQKIKEGKIKVICGYLQNFEGDNEPDYFYCTLDRIQDAQTEYPTYYYRQTGNDSDADIFTYVISISFNNEEPYFSAVLGKLKNGSLTPSLPSDASSKTYTLRSVNRVLTWVDTSVGTQKFENVEVSGTITTGGKSLNTVEANPSDAATTSLNKIKIGNVTYNIVGSSGSGGSSGSDGSTGNSSFVAFEYNNIITNGKVNDGVFQELTNLINTHKVPVIIDDQRTYSYSGMATSPDGGKNGLAFVFELHSYDASSYTYLSGQLPLILWSDNSISGDAMAFGSIPTPPYDQTGTKQYVLSGTDMGLTWIDIDEKISSAITSTLEANY